MTTTDIAEGGGPTDIEALEAELEAAIRTNLDKGFDEAVALAAETMAAKTLFALPAAELIDGADRVAAVWLGDEASQTIVFAVLDEAGPSVRIEHGDGAMEDMERFAGSFIDVLGQLRDLDIADAA